jgi:hypothetical protein
MARGGDQFLRLAPLGPRQRHPFLGRVPIQPHHLARHQTTPAKIGGGVKGQNRVAQFDFTDWLLPSPRKHQMFVVNAVRAWFDRRVERPHLNGCVGFEAVLMLAIDVCMSWFCRQDTGRV